MSWEVEQTKKIPCPCGKGNICMDILGDDWNNIREDTPIICCSECSKKYKIESKYFNPKPGHDYTIYYCVEKNNPETKIKLDL